MTQEMQKQALGLGQLFRKILPTSVEQPLRMGIGGAAGYFGNDAYLNQVNPDVSDVGRARSNILGAALGAGLGARGGLMLHKRPGATAAGLAGLALRYGVIMPDQKHNLVGFGAGDWLDPGHSKLPKGVGYVWQPNNQEALQKHLEKPITNTLEAAADYGTKLFNKIMDSKGKDNKQQSVHEMAVGGLKETALPALYSSAIKSLGGTPGENPTFVDVGMAVAPHITGGAGGGYLGYLLSRAAGNYMFRDNPNDGYDERRRQESRRNWLNFLGSNLGVLGGVLATAKSMPQLNSLIGQYVTKAPVKKAALLPFQKQALGLSWLINSAKATAKSYLPDVAAGAGITGAQYYGGIVPAPYYDADNKPQGTSYGLGLGLLPLNTLLARKARTVAGNPNYFTKRKVDLGGNLVRRSPLTAGLSLGVGLSAGPSILNTMSSAIPLNDAIRKTTARINADEMNSTRSEVENPSLAIRNWVERPGTGGKDRAKKLIADRTYQIATDAAIPGFGNKQLSQALTAGLLSSIGQTAGITSGGFAGMLGTNWAMDKLLTLAEKKKWLKRRPRMHAFIRDLASLIGAGAGAYGTMRLMNSAIPALAARNAAGKPEAAKPDAAKPEAPAAAAAQAAGQQVANKQPESK